MESLGSRVSPSVLQCGTTVSTLGSLLLWFLHLTWRDRNCICLSGSVGLDVKILKTLNL